MEKFSFCSGKAFSDGCVKSQHFIYRMIKVFFQVWAATYVIHISSFPVSGPEQVFLRSMADVGRNGLKASAWGTFPEVFQMKNSSDK